MHSTASNSTTTAAKVNLKTVQRALHGWEAITPGQAVQQVSATENQRQSDRDFQGIYQNPAQTLQTLSGVGVPLGWAGYGSQVDRPLGPSDLRQFRFLSTLPVQQVLNGHIALVGPTGAGKSQWLYGLTLNLALNYGFSVVMFSTKLSTDLGFAEACLPNYQVISANETALTRLTHARFNPLSRITVVHRQVNPADCRRLADTLIQCIPLDHPDGETEKFRQDAAVRLAALIELVKYGQGDRATLGSIVPLWTILAKGDADDHPLEPWLSSSKVPASARKRLRTLLKPLLHRQPEQDAMVGPTAQQLLRQLESLASLTAANDIDNFSTVLRQADEPQLLIVDQSDGLNTTLSQALARLVFPLLYEDLVAQTPPNWREQGLRPVLLVIDEVGSVFSGEHDQFLEKARASGVILAFGQQSTVTANNPRLQADLLSNSRLQVVFSGCDARDPIVEDLHQAAGRYRPPFEAHRAEVGHGECDRLPIDAIASLGPLATLVRIKSTQTPDKIIWMHQGNPLVPRRAEILACRQALAEEITWLTQVASLDEVGQTRLNALTQYYARTQTLLLRSYGYWPQETLHQAYRKLDRNAIDRSYQWTMGQLAEINQDRRDRLHLEHSRAEFTRLQLSEAVERQIDQRQRKAEELEALLFDQFSQEILPQLQRHSWWWSPLHKPRYHWFFFFTWGVTNPDTVANHWQACLEEYARYALAYGRRNSTAWRDLEPLVRLRIGALGAADPGVALESMVRWVYGVNRPRR